MRSGLHGDFDRGYFSAWGDCMRILTRMDIPAPTNPDNSKTGVTTDDGENAAEDTIETVRSDKSQVTIANFFNGDKKISVKTKKQVTVSESAVKTEEVAKKG
jgi:hypothetical protein